MNHPARYRWSSPVAPRTRRFALLLAGAAVAATLTTPPARAQEKCAAAGPEPYICGIEIEVAVPGERPKRLDPRRPLRLGSGETVELLVDGYDQFDRRFPVDRAGFVLEPSRRCERGAVEIRRVEPGRFRLEGKRGQGNCELLLWVPGNLNLEWVVPVALQPLGSGGFNRAQADWIAAALYRALLGREGDPPGLAGASAEIERGRLRNQVEAMVRSDEFRRERASLLAPRLLEDLYQGLLGRAPDRDGIQRYLRDVERGKITDVTLDILRSEEFERRLTSSPRGRR